jgi:hypothetical protein
VKGTGPHLGGALFFYCFGKLVFSPRRGRSGLRLFGEALRRSMRILRARAQSATSRRDIRQAVVELCTTIARLTHLLIELSAAVGLLRDPAIGRKQSSPRPSCSTRSVLEANRYCLVMRRRRQRTHRLRNNRTSPLFGRYSPTSGEFYEQR